MYVFTWFNATIKLNYETIWKMVIFIRVQVEDPGLKAGEGDLPEAD